MYSEARGAASGGIGMKSSVGWSGLLLALSLLGVLLIPPPIAAHPASYIRHQLTTPVQLFSVNLLEQANNDFSYQRIFPPDERRRVTPTTSFPASAVTLLVGEFADGTLFSCSGALISTNVVLTAAHCLYAAENGGWVERLIVVPGADRQSGRVVTPYGMTEAVDVVVPRGWVEQGEMPEFDFGLVLLADPLGTEAGSLAIAAPSDAALTDPSFSFVAAGYPGDKPFGTQWHASAGGFLDISADLLALQADLTEGMSGGPLLTTDRFAVFGIVSFESTLANVARRVTTDVIGFVEDFCADAGCRLQVTPFPAPPSQPTPTPRPTPTPGTPVSLAFVAVQPARWSTVLPGPVQVSATVVSDRPIAELIVRVAGQEARGTGPTVTFTAHLDPGNHLIEAMARDVDGRELRTIWDVVASWDLADGPWFDSRGRPRAEAINATARALVEAFRWHLYGMSWDGVDHRGDLPTHAPELQPGEPVPVLVTENGFDQQATEATLRALVEAFRWHLYGISWDGVPHPEVPTHAATVLPPEPVGPWFSPEGQPIPEEITRTLRSLVEAFRWHLYGATWDGQPRSDMPTHARSAW